MVLVQAEVDEVIKKSAEKWLENQGLFPDEAIRLFYRQVVVCHGLPFDSEARASGDVVEERWLETVEEVSAVSIPSVEGELREAHERGREMLRQLMEFKERRAQRKAARRAAKKLEEDGTGGR